MGFWDELAQAIKEGSCEGERKATAAQRERLSERDFDSFTVAASERPKARTIEDVQRRLAEANFVRWTRMQKDMRWLRKQMVKMNLNPDDARWML